MVGYLDATAPSCATLSGFTTSELIDMLNAEKRKQAHLHDVAAAATEVLENWATYFYDLWERTNT